MTTVSVIISPRAIIGLGNPGQKYEFTRHNIGFRVVDALAQAYHVEFKHMDTMFVGSFQHNGVPIFLIKPQTFMNDSGKVIPFLQKKGITVDQILVVHDELELPFGQIKLKTGGSAKGHNGLKSIIQQVGDNFHRLRVGIGRPEHREDVPHYVLATFKEPETSVQNIIHQSVKVIENTLVPKP